MSTSKPCGIGAVAGILLLTLIGGESAAAAPPDDCDAPLTIELTPDVPDASDAGFLSSLLDNHPAYRLELLGRTDPSRIEVELSGPGPGYLCRSVIEDMRRDGRVLSLHIDSDESLSTLPPSGAKNSPELWGVSVSSSGIGSLYWAAQHPGRAWKVLLPIRVRDSGGAE